VAAVALEAVGLEERADFLDELRPLGGLLHGRRLLLLGRRPRGRERGGRDQATGGEERASAHDQDSGGPNPPRQLTVWRAVHSFLSSSRAVALRLPGARFRSAKPFSRIVAFCGSVLRTSTTISSNVMASLPMGTPLA